MKTYSPRKIHVHQLWIQECINRERKKEKNQMQICEGERKYVLKE